MKEYKITYILNSAKETINIKSLDQHEAVEEFLKTIPDASVENVLSIIDLSKAFKSNNKIIIYVILSFIGLILFIKRGFFASILLGATTLGNKGINGSDGDKVVLFLIFGGVIFVIGFVLTIREYIRKKRISK